MKVLHIYLNVLALLTLIKRHDAITFNMSKSVYSVEAGQSVFLQATITGLAQAGVVWLFYPTGNSTGASTIYLDSDYHRTADRTKYVVTFTGSGTNLVSTLEIKNTVMIDSTYTFEITCNFYQGGGCDFNNKASATLSIYTTTTKTTSTKASSNGSTSVSCLEGSWNTIQYALIIITYIVLLVTTLLFHYSFHGTVPETFFLVFILVLSLILTIVSLIFWINPSLSADTAIVSVIIVCCFLSACLLLWILILHYSVRLGLNNEISLVLNIIICVIAVLELGSAILTIISNAYCSGKTNLTSIPDFNYSYIELIAALFLFLFSLFVFMIAAVIFFVRKKKFDSEKFSNLGKLITPAVTPFSFNVPKSSSNVQKLWQANKTDSVEEILPAKPQKLAPIFSRKRTFTEDFEKTNSAETQDQSLTQSEIKKENENKNKEVPPSIWEPQTLSQLIQPAGVNRSKSVLGARRVGDLNLSDGTNIKKESKKNRSLSSFDRSNLVSSDLSLNISNNDSSLKRRNTNSLTRISLS